MIKSICDIIIDLLKKNNIITLHDEDIYYFGIYQTMSFIINSVTSLIIFVTMNKIIEGFVFCIFYYFLRCFGGGYHSRSILYCYILSSLLIVMVLRIISYIKIHPFIIILGIFSFLTVFLISPVETQTKTLDSVERKVYKKKVRAFLIFALFFIVILRMINFEKGIICIILSFVIESIMQIVGKIDNFYNNPYSRETKNN